MRRALALFLLATASYAAGDLGRGRDGDVLHVHYPPDPVNVRTRNFYLPVQDYYMSCFGLPLEVYRSYNSLSTRNGPFGRGWTFNYDVQIVVADEGALRILESDGYINTYEPVAGEKSAKEEVGQIVDARKAEDVKYLGKPEGKGEAFYADFRKKLETDPAFLKRQREKYLGRQVAPAIAGKYISRERGTTTLEKTGDGYVRIMESGRREEYDRKGLLKRVSDRNENEIRLEYGRESRLERVTDSCGQSLLLKYSPRGKILEIGDGLGRKLKYEYDGNDRLTASTSLTGPKTVLSYDDRHRLTSITFPDGNKTEMVYDPKTGDILKQIGPGTKVTTYTYGKEKGKSWALVEDNEGTKNRYEYLDAEHQVIHTDRNGKRTITTLLACCAKPLTVKGDKGVVEEFKYDDRGNLISKSEGAKRVTTFTYEPRFNLPSEVKSPDGSILYFRYDNRGNLSYVRSSGGEHVKIDYGARGKISEMTDQRENVVKMSYNNFGKPVKIQKLSAKKVIGSIDISYDPTGEILHVDSTPKDPALIANIRDTLSSFLRLMKPSGIEFDI